MVFPLLEKANESVEVFSDIARKNQGKAIYFLDGNDYKVAFCKPGDEVTISNGRF